MLNEVQKTISTYQSSKFLIFIDSNKSIHVALKHSADSKIILEAYFHALLIGLLLTDEIYSQVYILNHICIQYYLHHKLKKIVIIVWGFGLS